MGDLLNALGFNAQVFLAQVVIFIVLVFAMKALFFDPILGAMTSREDHVKAAYHTVDETRREMEQLKADYDTRIREFEADARAHIQAAVKEAQTERERLLAEARAAAESTLSSGAEQMEREKTAAIASLRDRMAGLAVMAAGRALGSAADMDSLRRCADQVISADSAPTRS